MGVPGRESARAYVFKRNVKLESSISKPPKSVSLQETLYNNGEEFEQLFTDGWRDPGDDCARLGYYIVMALCFVMGPLMVWFGIFMFRGGPEPTNDTRLRAFGILFGLLGLATGTAMPIFAYFFFKKESKYWNLKKMTADRVVAGGMLFGIAVMWIGLRVAAQGNTAGTPHDPRAALLAMGALFLLGIAIFIIFLLIGLVYALLPRFGRTKILRNVRVVDRFALDEMLEEREAIASPSQEGWTAVITLTTQKGENLRLHANDNAFEMAYPNALGVAEIRAGRLIGFHPRLKETSAYLERDHLPSR